MTPREYGAHLATMARPLTAEQTEQAARVLAGIETPSPGSDLAGTRTCPSGEAGSGEGDAA